MNPDVPAGSDFDISLRLGRLEWRADQTEDRQKRIGERTSGLERDNTETRTLMTNALGDINELRTTLNKLIWAIVGLALTIAGATIAAAATQALP